MENCFAILEIPLDADEDQIKKAYRKLALKLHPDCETGDEEKFKELSVAYAVLIDPEKRRRHKKELKRPFGKRFAGFQTESRSPGFVVRASPGNMPGGILELVLSSKEAESGGIVLVDMPVAGTCRLCRGAGRLFALPCPECDGRGYRSGFFTTQVSIPEGVLHRQNLFANAGGVNLTIQVIIKDQ